MEVIIMQNFQISSGSHEKAGINKFCQFQKCVTSLLWNTRQSWNFSLAAFLLVHAKSQSVNLIWLITAYQEHYLPLAHFSLFKFDHCHQTGKKVYISAEVVITQSLRDLIHSLCEKPNIKTVAMVRLTKKKKKLFLVLLCPLLPG